jgi:hypothetical protein
MPQVLEKRMQKVVYGCQCLKFENIGVFKSRGKVIVLILQK